MRYAPAPGHVYPQLHGDKRNLLEENGQEIYRRLCALEARLTSKLWMGKLFHTWQAVMWSRGMWLPWLAVLATVPLLFHLGKITGSLEAAILLGVVLALGAGKMMEGGNALFRQEKDDWNARWEILVARKISKILWSAAYGHLPGMSDKRATDLIALISRSSLGTARSATEELGWLRCQYDSDLVGSAISCGQPECFFHKDWLFGGETRDDMGMTPLCRAVSHLDFGQARKLIEEGARLDVVARPYGAAIAITLLRIAMTADGAVKDLVTRAGVSVSVARARLREERLRMFTFLLEVDPKLWLESLHNGCTLAQHGSSGDSEAEVIVNALLRRQKLGYAQGWQAANDPRRM